MFMLPINLFELLGNNVEYCEFPSKYYFTPHQEQEERVKVRDVSRQYRYISNREMQTPSFFIP